MIELNFSGSSVAIGAMTRASSAWIDPERGREVADRVHEEDGADDDQGERREDLQVDDPQARHGRVVAMGATVDPVEAQRREVRGVDVGVGLEVALDVPGVDADQADRHDPLEPDRLERQEGRPDGDGVRDREVTHVVREDLRVDAHGVTGRAMPGRPQDGDAGHEHGEGREHERRAEDGPDADRVRRLPGREQDRDDRDQCLGERRPDRGQHRSDRALGQSELAPEPFDAVGEQLRAEQDDDQRADEDEDVHAFKR